MAIKSNFLLNVLAKPIAAMHTRFTQQQELLVATCVFIRPGRSSYYCEIACRPSRGELNRQTSLNSPSHSNFTCFTDACRGPVSYGEAV